MPIEVRRFGVGHRRPDGPPGTTGIEGQVIEGGTAGTIAELAFNRRARIAPHSNSNWTYFLVIEGGGWVGVGDERTRILAGEAAVWPPDVLHAAWTDGTPMRAIVVELARPPDLVGPGVVAVASPTGSAPPTTVAAPRRAARARGSLAPRPLDASSRGANPEAEQGEPL